jgi:hypothetical protein
MPKPGTKSAPAGKYKLIGVRWRKRLENGGSIVYVRGDEVELNAEEAARLVDGKYAAFVPVDEEGGINERDPIEDTVADADNLQDKADLRKSEGTPPKTVK